MWAGTRYEDVFNRMQPSSGSGWHTLHFWNLIYGDLHCIVRDFHGLSYGQGWRWLESNASERKRILESHDEELKRVARKYGIPEPSKAPQWTPSKTAAKKLSIAKKLEKLAIDVKPFAPLYAEQCLRLPSMKLAYEANEVLKIVRKEKRHAPHPETRHILDLMADVKGVTGKWHDPEIVELMHLAGLHHITTGMLRTLRARYVTDQTQR